VQTEGQKPPTSVGRCAMLKKEPAHPELSEMLKSLEDNCTKRSAGGTWLREINWVVFASLPSCLWPTCGLQAGTDMIQRKAFDISAHRPQLVNNSSQI